MKKLHKNIIATLSLITLTTLSSNALASNDVSLDFANAPAVEASANSVKLANKEVMGSFGGISAVSSQTQRDNLNRLDTVSNSPAVLQDVVVYAVGLTDVKYRWGGESPDWGLDCSGLVRHVYEKMAGKSLPHNAAAMTKVTKSIEAKDLQPGDLVFFNTRGFNNSHVGIYVGNDRFIHAPNRRSPVQIASLSSGYYANHFNGARRVISNNTENN